jgi:hypothetical protein
MYNCKFTESGRTLPLGKTLKCQQNKSESFISDFDCKGLFNRVFTSSCVHVQKAPSRFLKELAVGSESASSAL